MELTAHTREIKGKKVRFLRRQGITPAHIFGHGVEPVPLQCDTAELKKVLSQAGTTGIVGLKLDKAKKLRNVMVREVQKEPRTGELLHVDFYQVRMEEKLKVEVPIVITGEAPALRLKENFLSHELTSLTVECLPDAIPGRVEVDVSNLEEADQGIHVGDISLGEEITVLNNPEQLVAKISTRYIEKEEEVEEVEAEVEAEAEGEAPEAAAPAEEPRKESPSED
jgi:large subunit ribosomal protein L25